MSAAATYPIVRGDELQKIGSMSHVRRPSISSATGSYTSHTSSSHQHPTAVTALLSNLEDSGNINNRGLLQQSSSVYMNQQHRHGGSSHTSQQSSDHRDSSTFVNTGAATTTTGGGVVTGGLRRAASTGSLKQQQQSSASNNNNSDSHDGTDSDMGDRVVEEKRKRSNGNGYSIHRYTLGRLLGKGGFAKVYLCTAMDTGKNYAVKVVPKANLVKARAQQKLQAEIKIHRTLKHRHVCQFKHYFEDNENCYILLELCHNQSLNEMIKRRKRLTEPEAAYFMKQLLEATRYMHDEYVIHRDLKLGNLFIDKDMCIKVGDLGLATRVEDKDEKRKTICGTPNYIAPEIIQGDKSKRGHSFEVDIWSMGVILFTVLIGKPPYEAKDVKATYQRILNNEYTFPRHVDISSSAKSLIKSMLQTQPTDRPTLDEIEMHPFLAESHIPTFLPTSVLSIAPIWRMNEYGELVCTDKATTVTSEYISGKKPAIPRSNSTSARRPFASHEPNLSKASSSTNTIFSRKGDINMERVAKTAVAAMSNKNTERTASNKHKGKFSNFFTTSSVSSATPTATNIPAFEIYDESQTQQSKTSQVPSSHALEEVSSRDEFDSAVPSRTKSSNSSSGTRQTPSPPQHAVLTEEALCEQTKAFSIQSNPVLRQPSASSNAGAPSVLTNATESLFSTTDNDAEIFRLIVDHLDTVLNVVETRKVSYLASPLRSLSSRYGPSKWVMRYVDYTCKYGLGFLLNDGSSGVYFNDSTKTALDAHTDTFQYIERVRNDDALTPKRRGETIITTLTLNNYPATLKKKVTLLKHFRNYLLQQQLYDGVEDVPTSAAAETITATTSSSSKDRLPSLSTDLVYVKKWVRTKHAILFSLSNRTIQVIFYDQTEILLTPDVAYLTYVDKQRVRFTCSFTDELVGKSADIEKRLRYTKDIMMQLLTPTTKASSS